MAKKIHRPRPAKPPPEWIEAVKEFLAVIGAGSETASVRLAHLERSLDRLAYLQHGVTAAEPTDARLPPARDYRTLRIAVAAQFPSLGSYRLPSPVIRVGHGEIPVADAIDDITEIASELSDVLWHSEQASPEDAAWYFRHSFRNHWGEHLRALQFHLHGLRPQPGPRKGSVEQRTRWRDI